MREAEARAAAGAAHVDVGRPQTENRDAARRALVRRQRLERNVELGRIGVPLGVEGPQRAPGPRGAVERDVAATHLAVVAGARARRLQADALAENVDGVALLRAERRWEPHLADAFRGRGEREQRRGGLCSEGVEQWAGAGELAAFVCHGSTVAQMRRDATNVSRAALSYFTRCLTQDLTQACSSVLQLGGQSMRCV